MPTGVIIESEKFKEEFAKKTFPSAVRMIREERLSEEELAEYDAPEDSSGITLFAYEMPLVEYGQIVRLDTTWFDNTFWADVNRIQRKYNRRKKIANICMSIYNFILRKRLN